jgi:hypothetical protein
LDEELKMLMVALLQEKPNKAIELVNQIKKLLAGTHAAVVIQEPNVKKNTKGRPSAKKGQTTSTKRNQSAFEIVEEHMKKEKIAKKGVLKESGRKKAKRFKKAVSDDLENSDLEEEELLCEDNNDEGKEKKELFCKDNNDNGEENESHELEGDFINLNEENKLSDLNEENKLSKSPLVALDKGGETVWVKVITNPI